MRLRHLTLGSASSPTLVTACQRGAWPSTDKQDSWSDATRYDSPYDVASLLSAAATDRGFTSPYWLTLEHIKAFVPLITLTPDAGDGVTMQGSIQGSFTVFAYYNADQTTDPEAVAIKAYSADPIGRMVQAYSEV